MLNRLNAKLFLSLVAFLILISGCSEQTVSSTDKIKLAPKMESLVSTQWLSQHLNDSDLVVLDSSVFIKFDDKGGMFSVSGKENYDKGHIPSARFADLMGNLSGGDGSLDFIMPTPQQFNNAINDLGISNDSRVVIYSAENQVWSARLWWMFRWAGLEQVALLDGGLKAWKEEGRAISTETPSYTKTSFTLSLQNKMIAGRDEVLAAIDNEQVSIVDSLSKGHYSGKVSMYPRAGHITSAINFPVSDQFDELDRYRSLDELDMMFEGDKKHRMITYCGGGVAASSVAFTLYRLGYQDVAVYMGSLQEWTANPDNPMTAEVP